MNTIYNTLADIKDGIYQFKDKLVLQFNYSNTFSLFRTILFCFLLVDTVLTLPAASQLWGPNAYVTSSQDFPGFFQFLNLLNVFNNPSLYLWLVWGKIFFLTLGILNIAPLLCSIGTYICLLNLDNRAWSVMNGGNNIIHVVFIYIFLMHLGTALKQTPDSMRPKSHFFQSLGNVLANLAFLSARLQIIIVYFVAGLTKLQSHLWRDGVALYYVLNTREFTHPWAQKIFLNSDLLIMLGTYGTLLFQLSFPWLVWNRDVKKYVLAVGTFIHLQIAFVMGLFDFGITVSIMYLVFLNEEESIALRNKILPVDSLSVGFDHNCKLCLQFAKFVKFFDFKDRIIIDNALVPVNPVLQSVSEDLRLDKIASCRSSDGKVFVGFETIYEAVRRVPLLMPLGWIFLLMQFTIGNYVYRFISRNVRKKTGCYNGPNENCSI